MLPELRKIMTREDLLKFGHSDPDFMTNHYPYLTEDGKITLWFDRLTFDFRSGFPEMDPLSKFNKKNYEIWKSDEVEFDRFLDIIIEEYMPTWNFTYDGGHDLKTEIYKRLGKI